MLIPAVRRTRPVGNVERLQELPFFKLFVLRLEIASVMASFLPRLFFISSSPFFTEPSCRHHRILVHIPLSQGA